MKIDLIRLFLRFVFCGFILGRYKKTVNQSGHARGFVHVVFPRPAADWTPELDFLWEPQYEIPKEIKKNDLVIFLGLKKSSGWRARYLIKVF